MDHSDLKVYDATIRVPFSLLINGPSGCGKTDFTIQLLKERKNLIDKDINNICWFYSLETKSVKNFAIEFKDKIPITFVKGLPENIEDYIDDTKTNLFIFDDLMDQATQSSVISDLFTKGSHHRNISIILIVQDFFYNGNSNSGFRKTISRNANLLCLFCNYLDSSSISTIGARIMPKRVPLFLNIFKKACSESRYLFIDGKHDSDGDIRLRTDIFGDHQKVFTVN